MMSTSVSAERSETRRVQNRRTAEGAVFSIIMALGFSHFLNDMMQSLVPALYPMLKGAYGLSFAQIGLITLVTQVTSSLLQPAVGLFADHRPPPYSLAIGMGATLVGLILLASAGSYSMLVLAAALVGVGSAVFHPEASRVARMASGGRHGLAQSLFQVGGNIGSSLGPILAAFIVIPKGQSSIAWFSPAALLAMTGLILASASSAIIVYALELVPGKIGTVAGLFFGLSFGMAGVGAAALGRLADATSIDYVYQVCAFLPLIGLLTVFLPNLGRPTL